MSKFLIVDGNSLAFRAVYAHNPKFGEDLKNSEGKLTGAAYRFMNMLNKIMLQEKPTHMVVAWDLGRDTFRRELYPEYKANREERNDDFYEQFITIKDILKALNIKSFGIKGYEADDIVGTYSKLSKADSNVVLSGDKDTFQLVNDKTYVIFPKGSFSKLAHVDEEYVMENYFVDSVDKFVLQKALTGDDGDNIPGIDGCAVKTAAKLINHYGTLEKIAENKHNIEVKGVTKKVKANIIDWADKIDMLKTLVTIKTDVDVPYSYEECELNLDWDNVLELFYDLEFESFIKKIKRGEMYVTK